MPLVLYQGVSGSMFLLSYVYASFFFLEYIYFTIRNKEGKKILKTILLSEADFNCHFSCPLPAVDMPVALCCVFTGAHVTDSAARRYASCFYCARWTP